MTDVSLPGQFTIRALHRFVGSVVGDDGLPISQEICFDFSGLRFIDGAGLTVFCNTLEWLNKNGVITYFGEYQQNTESIKYLDDCGFFRAYLNRPLNPQASVRRTTVPFTKVRHAESHGWLEHTATPWLARALNCSPNSLASVRTCAKEIFNNILDHTPEEIGCIHIQHYPNINKVEITISDFGQGIPANIRNSYGQMDDAQAISLAIRDGITTRSNARNAGAGLSILIDYVTGNLGSVSIYSLSGGLLCGCKPDGRPTRASWVGGGTYPGTLINISLRTDLFVGEVEEREDFQW